LAMDSLANAVTIWPSTVSLPQRFSAHPQPLDLVLMSTPGPSGTTISAQKETPYPPYPRAQAPRDQLLNGAKRAKPTQHQKVTRILQPAVLKHNLYRLSTQTVAECDNLPFRPSSSPSMNKEKERARRKAINACYRSAQTSHPTLPQQQPQCRVWRCIRTRAGEFGIERD
jgi:hypothetical protein